MFVSREWLTKIMWFIDFYVIYVSYKLTCKRGDWKTIAFLYQRLITFCNWELRYWEPVRGRRVRNGPAVCIKRYEGEKKGTRHTVRVERKGHNYQNLHKHHSKAALWQRCQVREWKFHWCSVPGSFSLWTVGEIISVNMLFFYTRRYYIFLSIRTRTLTT